MDFDAGALIFATAVDFFASADSGLALTGAADLVSDGFSFETWDLAALAFVTSGFLKAS